MRRTVGKGRGAGRVREREREREKDRERVQKWHQQLPIHKVLENVIQIGEKVNMLHHYTVLKWFFRLKRVQFLVVNC